MAGGGRGDTPHEALAVKGEQDTLAGDGQGHVGRIRVTAEVQPAVALGNGEATAGESGPSDSPAEHPRRETLARLTPTLTPTQANGPEFARMAATSEVAGKDRICE